MAVLQRRAQIYVLKYAALAFGGGAPNQQSFQVDTEYDFELFYLTAFVFDANGLGVLETQWPNITALLADGATKQSLTSDEAALRGLFGTGPEPHPLREKHVVQGGATFFATLNNRHAATAFSATLHFIGVLARRLG